jgi:hypothetical protein
MAKTGAVRQRQNKDMVAVKARKIQTETLPAGAVSPCQILGLERRLGRIECRRMVVAARKMGLDI